MNTKSTVVLLVIALLLGGYFLAFETDLLGWKNKPNQPATDDSAAVPAAGLRLFDPPFLADDITTVTIDRPDQPQVVIRKSGKQWQQVKPVVFPLTTWSVESLLNQAASLRYTNTIDPGRQKIDPASLGLKPARATVTFEGKTKAVGDQPATAFKHTVLLGRTVAAGRAYLQRSGESRVLVVADHLHQSILHKTLNDLRSKTLTAAESDQVESITLKRPDTTIRLARQDGRWRLSRPVTGRADTDQANRLIKAVSMASIDSFIADAPKDLARFGLDKPSRTLILTRRQSAKADKKADDDQTDTAAAAPTDRLDIGSQADVSGDKFYAIYHHDPDPAGPPVVFTLRKTDVEKLDVSPVALRSRKLIELDRSAIRGLTITSPDNRTLAFRRQKDKWVFAHKPAPAFSPDGKVIDQLFDALLKTESTDGKLLEQSALPGKLTTVSIDLGDAAKPRLLISRGEKTSQVLLAGETLASVVDTEKLKPLFADALYYRNRTVWDVKADQVQTLAIRRRTDHPADYQFSKTDGKWALKGFDQSRVTRLLDQLAPLRAEKWYPKELKNSDRTITVTMTTAKPQKTWKLTVLPDADNQAVATGCDMHFIVPDTLVDQLESELRDTTAIDLPIDQLASVVGDGWTVERDKNGVYTINGSLDLDEAKAGALFDTLAGLQVEYWLQPDAVQGPPNHTLTVVGRDKTRRVVKLWIPDDWSKGKARGVVDDGRPFELLRDTAEKLIAKPIKKPEK